MRIGRFQELVYSGIPSPGDVGHSLDLKYDQSDNQFAGEVGCIYIKIAHI